MNRSRYKKIKPSDTDILHILIRSNQVIRIFYIYYLVFIVQQNIRNNSHVAEPRRGELVFVFAKSVVHIFIYIC